MCSDRLPKVDGEYIVHSQCNTNISYANADTIIFKDGAFKEIPNWTTLWWLEEVPINTIKKEAWNEGFNQGSVAMLDPNKHEPNPYK